MQKEIIEVLKIVIIVAAFTALLFPMIKWISYHVGALDYPNERKVHKKPMPVMGGLMIYLGFLFGYMLFAPQSTQMLAILIASFIVVITGILDVINPLRAREKLVGQVVAALIIVFYGKILLNDISFFGYYFDFGWLAYPITLVFIVAVMNCINLIDGLDGLADGISMIFFITIGVLAFIMHNLGSLEITIAFIMIGACLGFLIFNFNPAKIFMGDSGSMFLGYIIAVIALLGFKNITLTSFIVPILLLAIPIMDTLFAILRRLINHKPLGEPDKNHLHHQLLKLRLSQRKTVLIIYLVDILFATASILYAIGNKMLGTNMYGIIIYVILFILTLLLVLKTNIIWNHDKKKTTDK